MMKKIKLTCIPLMAVSFLVSCSASSSRNNNCSVSFESNGANYIETQTIRKGEKAVEPSNLTRGNDKFVGWYSNANYLGSPYDFNTAVNSDITLYAKWDKDPNPRSTYSFSFTGTNCKVNGKENYEINLIENTQTQFVIVPNDEYTYPDSDTPSHFVVTGEGKDKVSYNKNTGVISISQMVGDVNVTAVAEVDTFLFEFDGHSTCTINGENFCQKRFKRNTKNLQFTILPNEGYYTPIQSDITFSSGSSITTYENGIITISNLTENVVISVNARNKLPIVVNFVGVGCRAGFNEDHSDAKYNFIGKEIPEYSLTLYILPDDATYILPDEKTERDFRIKFDDGECIPDVDYKYIRGERKIIIYKRGGVSIRMVAHSNAYHTLTFDAGEGKYGDLNKIDFNVTKDTELLPYIRMLEPTLANNTFAYYTYADGSIVDYNDKVTGDTTLKANYFTNNSIPYTNLNNLSWNQIQSISVTNTKPERCIDVGATKEITVNNKTHKVQVLEFNHDELVERSVVTAGITFEFVHLLTAGNSYLATKWDRGSSNTDYLNSDLRKALDGEGEGEISWSQSSYNDKTVFDMLPDDLKGRIHQVKKKIGTATTVSNATFVATDYNAKVFVLTHDEMASHGSGVTENEGSLYDYYEKHTSESNRKKKSANSGSDYKPYLICSPYTSSTDEAWIITDAGKFVGDDMKVNVFNAVAPAFCI